MLAFARLQHAAGFDQAKGGAAVKAVLSHALNTLPQGLDPADGGCERDQASQQCCSNEHCAAAVCMEGGCQSFLLFKGR